MLRPPRPMAQAASATKGHRSIAQREFVQMQQPQSQRPLGITILAILAAVAGVLGLLGSLTLLGFGLGIYGLLFLVLSVVYLVFAYGAWTLKPWAWTLGVGLSVAS